MKKAKNTGHFFACTKVHWQLPLKGKNSGFDRNVHVRKDVHIF